jgi:hypothetical protein
MTLLVVLLALNAVLHGVFVFRYGTDGGNMPFPVNAIILAALAVVVFVSAPFAIRATLVLSAYGLIGVSMTFGKPLIPPRADRPSSWGMCAANARGSTSRAAGNPSANAS